MLPAQMKDLLERMNRAAGAGGSWVLGLLEEHSPKARLMAEAGFRRLTDYFPESVLQETKVVQVPRIPFPPFSAMGLPEFAAIEQLPAAGITFRNVCFIHKELASESVHFHELVHAVQWRTIEVAHFMLTYGVGLLQHGYARSPLEVTAYDLQSQFDRGVPLKDAVETIRAQARQAHESAAEVFRKAGLEMGGSYYTKTRRDEAHDQAMEQQEISSGGAQIPFQVGELVARIRPLLR